MKKLLPGLAALLWMVIIAAPAMAQQQAQGILLVATPQLQDPNFSGAVVLVTRHGRSRPMGIILNRPFAAQEGQDPKPDRPLYAGGPVARNSLLYLFKGKADDGRHSMLSLGNELYLGLGRSLAEMLKLKPPAELKIFAGFATWAHGQLENEISRGDWLVLPLEPDQLLRQDVSGQWQELLAKASQRAI